MATSHPTEPDNYCHVFYTVATIARRPGGSLCSKSLRRQAAQGKPTKSAPLQSHAVSDPMPPRHTIEILPTIAAIVARIFGDTPKPMGLRADFDTFPRMRRGQLR